MRIAAYAVVVFAVVGVAAAPVPESVTHAKEFKKVFGVADSPDAGCTFHYDGETLTAKLSKEWVGSQYDHLGCLHTKRAVSGDFEVSVAMRTTAPAEPPKKTGGKRCDIGGGLAAWESPANGVAVCRFYNNKGRPNRWFKTDTASYPKVYFVSDDDEDSNPTQVVYLRLTRQGRTLTTENSGDGEKWTTVSRREVDLADALTVGVWAFNGTGQEYDVTFEKFTLTPLR